MADHFNKLQPFSKKISEFNNIMFDKFKKSHQIEAQFVYQLGRLGKDYVNLTINPEIIGYMTMEEYRNIINRLFIDVCYLKQDMRNSNLLKDKTSTLEMINDQKKIQPNDSFNFFLENVLDWLIASYENNLDFKKISMVVSMMIVGNDSNFNETYLNLVKLAENNPTDDYICICHMYSFLIYVYTSTHYDIIQNAKKLKDNSEKDLFEIKASGLDEIIGEGSRQKPVTKNLINKFTQEYPFKPKQISEMYFSSLITNMISDDNDNLNSINKKIKNYLKDNDFYKDINKYKNHLENNISILEQKCKNYYQFQESDPE